MLLFHVCHGVPRAASLRSFDVCSLKPLRQGTLGCLVSRQGGIGSRSIKEVLIGAFRGRGRTVGFRKSDALRRNAKGTPLENRRCTFAGCADSEVSRIVDRSKSTRPAWR